MTDTTDTEKSYDAIVKESVLIGIKELQAQPSLQFTFNMKSKGDLDGGSNKPARNLVSKMNETKDHSQSTINMAFEKLLDAALDMGRRVETRKEDGQLIVTIKPAFGS